MKTKFIQKLVLLTLFVSSFLACSNHPEEEKKGMDYNSYTEHVVENHLIIREKLQPFTDSIDVLAKQAAYDSFIIPLMMDIEQVVLRNDTLKVISQKDSLLYAMSTRLMYNYQDIVHRYFPEIYHTVVIENSENKSQKIDSIKTLYFENDRIGVKYFNQYLDSSFKPLIPFKL